MGLTPAGRSGRSPDREGHRDPARQEGHQSDRKFFPGYVLAKLALNDDVYHLVKNTPKVTGFLGPNGKPQAISEAEAARILDTRKKPPPPRPSTKIKVDYEIGDAVKVLDGPFASFNGVVEELDFDRSRVKVCGLASSAARPRSSSSSSRSSGSNKKHDRRWTVGIPPAAPSLLPVFS